METNEYTRTERFGGGGLLGYVSVVPATLVELFGQPGESDGYKVSGEYAFEDEDGNIFRVYDWKMTNLYDYPHDPSPEELWSTTTPVQLNIGGNGYAGDFIDWLEKECKYTLDNPKDSVTIIL